MTIEERTLSSIASDNTIPIPIATVLEQLSVERPGLKLRDLLVAAARGTISIGVWASGYVRTAGRSMEGWCVLPQEELARFLATNPQPTFFHEITPAVISLMSLSEKGELLLKDLAPSFPRQFPMTFLHIPPHQVTVVRDRLSLERAETEVAKSNPARWRDSFLIDDLSRTLSFKGKKFRLNPTQWRCFKVILDRHDAFEAGKLPSPDLGADEILNAAGVNNGRLDQVFQRNKEAYAALFRKAHRGNFCLNV